MIGLIFKNRKIYLYMHHLNSLTIMPIIVFFFFPIFQIEDMIVKEKWVWTFLFSNHLLNFQNALILINAFDMIN